MASSSNKFSAYLFLDISAAYGNVIPNILIHDMLKLGIPKRMCIFIYNLTVKRKIYFRINGENESRHILSKNLSQGCFLSPILYMIYTNYIHKVIDSNCKILEYADDIVLFSTSNDIEKCIQILQHSLRNLNSSLKKRGLSISSVKYKLILFPVLIRDLPENIHIQLDDLFSSSLWRAR